MTKWVRRAGSSIVAAASLLAAGCGGGGSTGSSPTGPGAAAVPGATLRGQIVSFSVARRQDAPIALLARLAELAFPTAHAAESGVTVSVGGVSTTTDSAGRFTLPDIPTGDQTVTFVQGSNTATYSLQGVEPNETVVLNDTSIAGATVTTEHTGFWVGTATGASGPVSLRLEIAANGNAVEGTVDIDHGWEVITWSGSENGTSMSGSFRTVSSGAGCAGEEGTFGGDFDGSDLTGAFHETASVAGCVQNDGTFTLSKQ